MERTITAALLLGLSVALASGCYASGPSLRAHPSPRAPMAALSGVCSALLFLRVRRPRDPK